MKLSSESSTVEAPSGCCANKWKQSICRGNTEYSLQFYGNAILLYNQALDLALHESISFSSEQLSASSLKSLDLKISQVLISQFNLADCYIALEEFDRACDYYISALGYLLKISQSINDPEFTMTAVMRAFGQANMLWLDFLKKYRNKIDYSRLLEFHHTAGMLNNREIQLSVCH